MRQGPHQVALKSTTMACPALVASLCLASHSCLLLITITRPPAILLGLGWLGGWLGGWEGDEGRCEGVDLVMEQKRRGMAGSGAASVDVQASRGVDKRLSSLRRQFSRNSAPLIDHHGASAGPGDGRNYLSSCRL